jgi:hypothetical protein
MQRVTDINAFMIHCDPVTLMKGGDARPSHNFASQRLCGEVLKGALRNIEGNKLKVTNLLSNELSMKGVRDSLDFLPRRREGATGRKERSMRTQLP